MPDTKYMKYKNNNLTFAKTSNANELKHGLEIESQGFESSQIMGPFQIVFIGIYQTNMLLFWSNESNKLCQINKHSSLIIAIENKVINNQNDLNHTMFLRK